MLIKGLKKLHRYVYFAAVLLFFLPFWPILYYWSRNPERHYGKFVRVRRVIGWLSSSAVGIFYRFRFEVPIDWTKSYVICPNHTSNLDITAMVLLCKADFSFIGKQELLRNPVTGMFFRTIDIPINRDSKISAFKAFKRAAENIDRGRSMLIFPEGKIGDGYPPELCELKTGPFRLAIEKNIPILPVVIQDAWKVYWDDGKRYGSRPGQIQVDVCRPIDTTHLTLNDVEALRDQTTQVLQSNWRR